MFSHGLNFFGDDMLSTNFQQQCNLKEVVEESRQFGPQLMNTDMEHKYYMSQ